MPPAVRLAPASRQKNPSRGRLSANSQSRLATVTIDVGRQWNRSRTFSHAMDSRSPGGSLDRSHDKGGVGALVEPGGTPNLHPPPGSPPRRDDCVPRHLSACPSLADLEGVLYGRPRADCLRSPRHVLRVGRAFPAHLRPHPRTRESRGRNPDEHSDGPRAGRCRDAGHADRSRSGHSALEDAGYAESGGQLERLEGEVGQRA
jgi:hypothetical protein